MGLIFLGVVGILVVKFLLPLVYWAIGKMLKGKASRAEVQLLVAYSSIPYLIYLAIGIILILPAFITQDIDLVFYRHPFTYYVIWIFAIRNLIFGLSYFNKFSYRFALLNVIIPVFITELVRLIITNWIF